MPQSFELMKRRISELTEKLISTRMKKGEFGKDGDPWDDPVLYELERDEKTLLRLISEVKSTFNDAEIIGTPTQIDSITLGHRIKVKFLDDFFAPSGGIFVTLVTPNDSVLLVDKFGFDNDTNLVVSIATPLGKAMLGAEKGNIVRYDVDKESLRVKILDIEISPLFKES